VKHWIEKKGQLQVDPVMRGCLYAVPRVSCTVKHWLQSLLILCPSDLVHFKEKRLGFWSGIRVCMYQVLLVCDLKSVWH
jgi:hypothetical protein